MNQIQQTDVEIGEEGTSQQSNIWQGDQLSRAKEAELLKTFLLRRVAERVISSGVRSYVLNVDSPWGSGKTFFLTRFQKQLTDEGFIVAYVNAWEDDHASDPLLPVLASIDETVSKFTSKSPKAAKLLQGLKNHGLKIAISLGNHATKKLVGKFFGDAVDEIPDILSEPDQKSMEEATAGIAIDAVDEVLDSVTAKLLDEFAESKKSITFFKSNLSRLVKSIGETDQKHTQIFIFIDELDRCRPTYAISMLERIKHLFDTDGVIFVLATDTSQLRHSIKSVYGNEFDSSRYLLRFFDRQYHLKNSNKSQVIKVLFSKGIDSKRLNVPPGIKTAEEFFELMVKGFQLTIRDIEQCFELLNDITTIWKYKSALELTYLLPLVILHQQGRPEFDALANGEIDLSKSSRLTENLSWEIEVHSGDRYDRSRPEKIAVSSFLSDLLVWKTKSLPDITSRDARNAGTSSAWATRCFSTELSVVHNNRWSDPIPYSVLKHYGEIVRSISNFSD